MKAFEDLELDVLSWAVDRDIQSQSDPVAQIGVTIEEVSELLKAVNYMNNYVTDDTEEDELSRVVDDIKDAYGDILVTLIISHGMIFGPCITECLDKAYNTIKDRKGKMVNGKFVKEADL